MAILPSEERLKVQSYRIRITPKRRPVIEQVVRATDIDDARRQGVTLAARAGTILFSVARVKS
jgi:hypothetical protein